MVATAGGPERVNAEPFDAVRFSIQGLLAGEDDE